MNNNTASTGTSPDETELDAAEAALEAKRAEYDKLLRQTRDHDLAYAKTIAPQCFALEAEIRSLQRHIDARFPVTGHCHDFVPADDAVAIIDHLERDAPGGHGWTQEHLHEVFLADQRNPGRWEAAHEAAHARDAVLAVADGVGDRDEDGEPIGTVNLPVLADDLGYLARYLEKDVPALLAGAACPGGCDGDRLLIETAAQAELAGLAGEIESAADRLMAVRAVLARATG
jgi:hypothetical protein